MRHTSRPWPLLLLALTMCPSISRHELACEEARARLLRCCPGFTGEALGCQDTTGELYGCDQVEIDLSDARCVIDRSCQALVEGGVCERASQNWNAPLAATGWNATVCLP